MHNMLCISQDATTYTHTLFSGLLCYDIYDIYYYSCLSRSCHKAAVSDAIFW